MKRPGRKSAASLSVKALMGPTTIVRPEPPYSLTNQEVDVWRMIVNAVPADMFAPSTHPLLTQLCRHVVMADRVKMLIEQMCKKKTIVVDELHKLVAMQNAESAAIVRLMRSLRLSPSSIYRGESRKIYPIIGNQTPLPWDGADEDAGEVSDD